MSMAFDLDNPSDVPPVMSREDLFGGLQNLAALIGRATIRRLLVPDGARASVR